MHNIPSHQIARIDMPVDERQEITFLIEDANQFVVDNYGPDDTSCYIATSTSGFAMFPVRNDIVGNFLIRARMKNSVENIAGFIANLRRAMAENGIRIHTIAPTTAP